MQPSFGVVAAYPCRCWLTPGQARALTASARATACGGGTRGGYDRTFGLGPDDISMSIFMDAVEDDPASIRDPPARMPHRTI